MESQEEQEDDHSNELMTIVEPEDVNDDEKKTMKGDLVGDTSYSGRWILQTLISLSKLPEEEKWSSELEEDLCYLWDMTAEKDVVLFLIDNQFLSIAEYVLNISTADRLTEIVVGIIGNLCCQPGILPQLAEKTELVDLILNLLLCKDTETIIQVLRVLQVAIWHLQGENLNSKWLQIFQECKFFGTAVTFILQSSMNENLLTVALDFLQSISRLENSFFANTFCMRSLLSAIVEAFSQLIPHESQESHSTKEMKIIENWLEILSKILEISSPNVKDVIENDEGVVNGLAKILGPYRIAENLKMGAMEDPRTIDLIQQSIELIDWFQKTGFGVNETAIATIFDIMGHLQNLTASNFNNTEENLRVKELQKYLEAYCLKLQPSGGLTTSESSPRPTV